ncbi:SRPBCC family protein [Geodermatophilus sp. SYSU D00691]
MPGIKAALAAVATVGYGVLQWLGRGYGATPAERHRPLPGDGVCREPQIVTTHATTIDAPPERVWPWLAQMGWGRGQWYTARWVDRLLFPRNGPSAETVVPEWQHLAVGDRILDGPPEAGCSFVVADLDPPRYLVLHSTEHLPPGWADRFGAGIDWSWSFVLDRVGDGRTRFVFRTRVRLRPWWVTAFYAAVVVPADFVMSRQMLRGVGVRAERTAPGSVRPRSPAA